MLKLLVLVAIIGGAAYFTRPGEAVMREAANTVLKNPDNISEGIEGLGATLAGDRVFNDYYVATKYAVQVDGKTVVDCWGAFTKANCARVKDASSGAPS